MSEKVKVSVIVPVYNVEKYLRRCLDSIVNQTLKDIEIICVNDGSTDSSFEILKEYKSKDDRIKVIDKRNEGVSIARNTGIDIASGDFIGFVDSDDWVDLDFYEKLYAAAIRTNSDIAAAEIIRLSKYNKKYHLKFEKEISTDVFAQKLEICDVPDKSYVWNKIYKRDKINAINLRFKPGMIFEDVIFTPVALHDLGKLTTVAGISYYYWRNSNSLVTQRHEKAKQDSFWAHKWALDYFKEHGIDTTQYSTTTKRYKFLGFSIFKIRTKNGKTTYSLFNIIKWQG